MSGKQRNLFEVEKSDPVDPNIPVHPDVYVKFAELKERGGDAGLHLARVDGESAVLLRYHSTPLWKYDGANGVRADIVDFCLKCRVQRIYFENLHPDYRSVRSATPARVKCGVFDNIGDKGLRYYLAPQFWKDESRVLEIGWTNRVTKL